jgi:histidinol dehydrogenase
VRAQRVAWDGADPGALAERLRAAVPAPAEIASEVAGLAEEVRAGGDGKVIELGERFDGIRVERLEVSPDQRAAALEGTPRELRDAMAIAAANIRAVAEAQVDPAPAEVGPGQGQTVTVASIPVGAAGIYVPGGRAPYPSTALMGVIAARSAGVERVVVTSPPGPEGIPDPATLAACELAGADAVYAVGGVQAIAALAYGTESIPVVDVIAGPGGPWVQEAKLAVSRVVGIDGYAGPSELVVVADGSAPAEWMALDLCAQAEHGGDGLLVAIAVGEETLEALERAIEEVSAQHRRAGDVAVALVPAPDPAAAVTLADALAPEHLQLCCDGAGELAGRVRTAGCVLVGPQSATAFGDYAAGSNHVLPTGGAGRFSGPLGPETFRRRISIVEMSSRAAVELAPVVETIARAEGFPVHAASARARVEAPGQHGP